MSCNTLSSPVEHHLVCSSESVAYAWFTERMPAALIKRAQILLKAKCASSIFQTQVAMQTAVIRSSNPDTPATVGSAHTDSGEWAGAPVDVGGMLAGKAVVRFGVAYKLTSAGFAQAEVSLQIATETCGRSHPTVTLSLATATTTDSFVPVSGWLQRMSAEVVRGLVNCRATGNFRWKLAYRLASTSTEVPGSWTALESTYRTTGEFNTGDLTPTFDGEMWVQIGLLYSSSDTSQTSATVSVVLATRKA